MNLEKELGFKVTLNTSLLDEEYNITAQIKAKINEAYTLVKENKKDSINRLIKYVEMYPSIPHFKNYLSVAYSKNKEEKRAREINNEILKEHPEYLFGKLNLANEYLMKNKYEKIPEIFGEDLELKNIYPARKEFHEAEVLQFTLMTVKYFLKAGKRDEAKRRMNLMEKVNSEDEKTYQAQQLVIEDGVKQSLDILKQDKKNLRIVKSKEYDKSVQTNRKPVFNHKIIEELYCNDFGTNHSILNQILKLPRETIIGDLEQAAMDSIYRFEYFYDKAEREGWNEKKFTFPIHALLLLGELKSEESLPVVLNLLQQGKKYLDFWYSDFITDSFFEPLYKIANNDLNTLKLFLFKPNIYTFGRCVISAVVSQITLHQPERRDEVISWYKEVINYFLENINDENIIDSDIIAFIICDIADFYGRELKNEVINLYKADIVSQTICGTEKDLVKDLMLPVDDFHKREIMDIYQRYNYFQRIIERNSKREDEEDEDYLEEDEPFTDYDLINETPLIPVKSPPKIGRNDPCPCGSGKKYKNCCLNKE